MTHAHKSLFKKVLRSVSLIFLCLSAVAAFMGTLLDPQFPRVPEFVDHHMDCLDPSWVFALNQAVAQKLLFGKDIIFTYGPYASALTGQYHPGTNALMLLGGLLLGGGYALLCFMLSKGTRIYWLVLYGVFITCFMYLRDTLFMSYPFLMALLAYRIALPPLHYRFIAVNKPLIVLFMLILIPLGLIPLTKISFLVITAAAIFMALSMFAYARHFFLAAAVIVVPVLSGIFFWLLAGQPVSAIPGFFLNNIPIIAGYGEAMAYAGGSASAELVLLCASLAPLPLLLMGEAGVPRFLKAFLFALYGLFLFIAFKSGFTRFDHVHDFITFAAIFIIALSLNFILQPRLRNIIPLLATLPLVVVNTYYVYDRYEITPAEENFNTSRGVNVRNAFDMAFTGIGARLANTNIMEERFDESLKAIRATYALPVLEGTTDVYSYDQAYLIASGNRWAPRPVLQSYSAYMPSLLKLDKDYLEGSHAPDNILLSIEPIDNRLPSLEDGLSWPVFLEKYRVVKKDTIYAYLKKKEGVFDGAGSTPIFDGEKHLDEEVALPSDNAPLYAVMDASNTLPGKLVAAFYKPPELALLVTLADGRKVKFRMNSGMMRTPFIISPLVENTQDFVSLMNDDPSFLQRNRVTAITLVSSEKAKSKFWKSTYMLRLSQRALPALKLSHLIKSVRKHGTEFNSFGMFEIDSPHDQCFELRWHLHGIR